MTARRMISGLVLNSEKGNVGSSREARRPGQVAKGGCYCSVHGVRNGYIHTRLQYNRRLDCICYRAVPGPPRSPANQLGGREGKDQLQRDAKNDHHDRTLV